jgi:hypothetical protein
MNKKFFTLIAGLLMLAASLGTATAQFSTGKQPTVTPEKLVVGELYQLGVTDQLGNIPGTPPALLNVNQADNADYVLAMVADNSSAGGGRYRLIAMDVSLVYYLANTLWRLQISDNAEGAKSYSFVNVATGQPLNFDPVVATKQGSAIPATTYATPVDNAVFVGGSVGTWKWQAPKPDAKYFRGAVLTAAFASLDSALTLVGGSPVAFSTTIGSATVSVGGTEIGAVKYSVGNTPSNTGSNGVVVSGEQVFLTPYKATPVLLTPDDLNSMLWSQRLTDDSRVSFTFTPNVQNSTLTPGNLFTSGSFKATWAVGYPADYSLWNPDNAGAQSNYQPNTTAYNTAQFNVAKAEYSYKYLKAKREFGLKIAGIIFKYANPSLTTPILPTNVAIQLNDIGTALALVDASNRNPGSQNVPGTAAYFIKNHGDVTLFLGLPGTTDFQKEIVQAVIDFAEIELEDPEGGNQPINILGGNVYGAILTQFTTGTWPAPVTRGGLEAMIGGINSAHPSYLPGYGTEPWTSTRVSDLLSDYNDAYDALKTLEGTAPLRLAAVSHQDARWVSLIVNDSYADDRKWTYLAVDTNYLTDRTDLKFAVKSFADVSAYYPNLLADDPARLDLNGRFNFQFLWYPTEDSLSIRAGGFAKIRNDQKNYGALNTIQNPDLGLTTANIISTDLARVTSDYYTNNERILDRNVVKLARLSDDHTELTVGDSEHKAGATPRTTINTKITIAHSGPADDRTTLGSGLYFINLKTNSKIQGREDGAYKVVHIKTSFDADLGNVVDPLWVREDDNQLSGSIQNFAFMPATQWVVEQAVYGDNDKRLVSIYNREYPHIKIENVQLYKAGSISNGYTILFGGAGFASTDTLIIREVKAVKTSEKEIEAAYKDPYLGYYKEKTDSYYNLDYLHGLKMGNFLKVLDSKTDSVLYVDIRDTKGINFELVPWDQDDNKSVAGFGYNGNLTKGSTKLFEALKREAYRIQVKAPNLLFANGKYVRSVDNGTGELSYAVSLNGDLYFLLKENNRVKEDDGATEGTPFFALEESYIANISSGKITGWEEGAFRFGIKDGSLAATVEEYDEQRVAAFALRSADSYLYRRFDGGQYGSLKEDFGDATNAPVWLKFFKYNNYGSDFLSENSPENKVENGFREDLVNKTISFLGVANKYQYPELKDTLSYTFYVDTAYVRNKTVMPQYMLALNPDIIEENWLTHETDGTWRDKDGNIIMTDEPGSETFYFPAMIRGQYLFNATDSVLKGNKDYEGKFNYGAPGSTRFAFVDGIHFRDTFYVLPEAYKTLSTATIAKDTLRYLQNLPDYLKHNLGDNTHYVPRWGKYEDPKSGGDIVTLLRDEDGNIINNGKSMVFQFRLIDEQNRRFLIETTTARTYQDQWDNYYATHNVSYGYPYTGYDEIAPIRGQWMAIKSIQLPVVSEPITVIEGTQNGAEIFDVTGGEEGSATANEAITETTVKVISETGAVTILNAAGKSVAISNILGQTVANAVLTSDNARVALPKGIVIVAVEGEPAIKAVVK